MESDHQYASTDHDKKNSKTKREENKPLVERKHHEECSSPLSSDRSSSSSSCSSLEFNTGEKGILHGSSPLPNKLDGNSPFSPESNFSSPEISSNSSPWQMKSPQIQTMVQQQYDPNRIPSSIFSTKPTTPTDWSVASNESLFSIHMGNNSFSRDNAVLFGKSGELSPWLEEWNSNSCSNLHQRASEAKSSELIGSLPPVMEESAHEEQHDVKFGADHVSRIDDRKVQDPNHCKSPKAAGSTNLGNQSKEDHYPAPATSSSLSRLSDESGNSCSSFAFPILVSDGAKSRSLKVIDEKPQKSQMKEMDTPKADAPKAESETRCFSCISSCWPKWCC